MLNKEFSHTETSIPHLGLDSEGGADQVSGAATRKPNHSSANEDAGPGALSGVREEGQGVEQGGQGWSPP